MSNQTFEQRDIRLNGVRAACAAITETLARLPEATDVEKELRARWTELVAVLELEPAHKLRACPVCKGVGMLEATRCSHCWAKLTAPTATDALPG